MEPNILPQRYERKMPRYIEIKFIGDGSEERAQYPGQRLNQKKSWEREQDTEKET